ncbi:alpha/beta-hydrolase [Massarina eburnea CBS 473.64]|uniref:Alpha/beta-hydrolase n=1 Tax=Massarina eburnea CBS 473.64 TaxID=1395130 RepID=A0A6A6S4C0_9PLEO|nr:alpha/beta-hydrolase [Massarina eburnea CBS 473.64]
MPVNTITVGAAVTPTVIHTYISHYLNRRPLHEKPTAHISYHEGLELIRQFLHYTSFHTVEDLQAFTSQWVPVPIWVDVDRLEIANRHLKRAADYIRAQLGPEGIKAVGGPTWWEWRREEGTELKAEWIEMRKDMEERKKSPNVKGQRVMLYVHGGAYYFGSVDEHRYQMQRHARKLKARVLAPRYRLSPQFPFPCGLMDCLAAYLHLLEEKHDPSTIILAGDSAGGGMVLTLLVVLRDQGLPLPAGAVLISPWCDLTHSFPSLDGDGKMDYIPNRGFIHKPSINWPPPNSDDLIALEHGSQDAEKADKSPAVSPSRFRRVRSKEEHGTQKEEKRQRVRGFSLRSADQPRSNTLLKPPVSEEAKQDLWVSSDGKYSIGPRSTLSLELDGTRVEIKDQIQMYAPNHMLTHPLVSPALQPSLGGLPPLLIQVGGGELLKDEQIYIAHKAAAPLSYLPPPSNNQTAETIQAEAGRHKPTNVQLQVWDDMCHVGPTLSFTRPAKHMYRSIAQFGAWALARAQKTSIDILDDDSISFVSTDTSMNASDSDNNPLPEETKLSTPSSAQQVNFLSVADHKKGRVGHAGDSLPDFHEHMIRQRVDRHGRIYALAPQSELVALNVPQIEIGVPKPGPVKKWMAAHEQCNVKFSKQKVKIQKQRMKDMKKGYEGFRDETPPPTALAGRQLKGMKKERRVKKSWGMALWSVWGSKHDEATIGREEKADQFPELPNPSATTEELDQALIDGAFDTKPPPPPRKSSKRNTLILPTSPKRPGSNSRSRHATVTYQNQTGASGSDDLAPLADLAPEPDHAEATILAPERKVSPPFMELPLPSPMSEFSTLGGGERTPDTTAERDREGRERIYGKACKRDDERGDETLIPETDSSTTRPTRGGIAYPFRLKVGKDNGEVNASTLTLQSMGIDTPGLEGFGEEARRVGGGATVDGKERPGVERFVTAGMGELTGNAVKGEEMDGKDMRPGVERFETAAEDFATVKSGNGRA